jgi:transcriptional regulator with XRE-family HTH domain
MATSIYLRTVRRRRRLTQAQLAQKSGIAQNTISKLEANMNARPALATVAALAEALAVNPLALRFGPDPRQLKELAAAEQRAAERLRRLRRQLKEAAA